MAVAVIKKNKKKSVAYGRDSALKALTTAAMVLPGMISSAHAADSEVTIQYGHYEEAKRDIYAPSANAVSASGVFGLEYETGKVPNNFHPITVDSIHIQAKTSFFDRLKFTGNYTEDTWSGATPVATAPAGFGGNTPITTDEVVTGASPYLESIAPGAFFDSNLSPVIMKKDVLDFSAFPPQVKEFEEGSQLVHTMAMASPETRKQGDFNLSYEWDKYAVDIGGGISIENDYESRFVNWGGRLDLNNKLTSLNFSQSYTNSTTSALLDHDALPYLATVGYADKIKNSNSKVNNLAESTLVGEREDWATSLSITQVLNKSALLEAGVGYTHSSGFMENPYKAVYVFFEDPDQPSGLTSGTAAYRTVAYIEERPEIREQWNFKLRYIQHISPLDAALNVKYNFFHDDWGINAHTFEGNWVQPLGRGWSVTPTVRYYSQNKADFYTPYLVSKNKAVVSDKDNLENYNNIPQENFSSDHRLSGYGALSGGVVISKQFARGLSLEFGFEYYTHEGALKLGGDGEGGYADFSSYSVNGALKVDIGSVGRSMAYSEHAGHNMHHGTPAPAGVMSAHMLDTAGDWMIGYRYMYGRQAGDMLQGNNKINDGVIQVSDSNCGGSHCYVAPDEMTMHMHMFNIMYAPTDWLNLMLMPTFIDMSMGMRSLAGEPELGIRDPDYPEVSHAGHEHMTGGLGDTKISALFKLYADQVHHLHLGIGVSAPTGDVDIELRDTHGEELGLIHYGMQLGSGTWDFTPNMTYTGNSDKWSWGAQLSGIVRLESQNESGYRLGDKFQSTVWGSYNLLNWLSMSVRGVYTSQGALHGEYNDVHSPIGPMDSPESYGGEYYDLGFGINAIVPTGDLAGNSLSVEWIQPMEDDVNGYQLERDGTLSVNWGYAF